MAHPERPPTQGTESLIIELPSEVLDIIDLERLKKVTKLTDEARRQIIERIEKERGTEGFLWEVSILKTIEPTRFEQDIHIDEEDWDAMIDSVEETRSHTEFFVPACARAFRIGGERMKQEIEILEDDWKKILRDIQKSKKYPLDYVHLASLANEIKPEGEPNVTIPRAEWEQMKDDLTEKISKEGDSRLLMLATELGSLRVEK